VRERRELLGTFLGVLEGWGVEAVERQADGVWSVRGGLGSGVAGAWLHIDGVPPGTVWDEPGDGSF
jgi:hypothetical protein